MNNTKHIRAIYLYVNQPSIVSFEKFLNLYLIKTNRNLMKQIENARRK